MILAARSSRAVALLLISATVALATSAFAAPAAETEPILGDWEGVLDVGGAKLRLAIHLTRADDGSLRATLDSLDQGAMGLPVATATFESGTLRLGLPNLGASYEGGLNEDKTGITGTWSQGPGSFPLVFKRPAEKAAEEKPPAPVPSDPIKPTWLGTLDAGAVKLRIAFHLTRDQGGILKATMDSLDQGATGIPFDTAVFKDGTLTLEVQRLAGRYVGTMNEDGTKLTGSWTQGPNTLPLDMTAVDEIEKPKRPQEPTRPLPYLEEEVSFRNASADIKLAGTLTMPKTGGPFPAVVLITGSGPEDRDETVFGHKPFLVLSDHLTRQGIAVLRYDDRGVGGSDAGTATDTSEDFANDALAAVAFLKTRKEIDPKKIGLVGHSEGGLIAPIAATRSSDVAFIVLMAGPGLPGKEILLLQGTLIGRAAGASEPQLAATRDLNAKIYKVLEEEKDRAAAEQRIRELMKDVAGVPKEAVDAMVMQVLTPWFRYFVSYDPRPTLAQVKVPILAINGERDLQVPAKENIDAIRETLEKAGHKDHELAILPGLNHLFQESTTGSPTEYTGIEQTFSPVALKRIADWILKR